MSQGTLIFPTSGVLPGITLVQMINDALDNLSTHASGAADPATLAGGVQPYSFWVDTSASPAVLKMRRPDDAGWLAVAQISATQFDLSAKGQPGGYATLDSAGIVPSSQLPSYVDGVLEYATRSAFPSTGLANKIYVAIDTAHSYRWSGSVYIDISGTVDSVNGLTGIVSLTDQQIPSNDGVSGRLWTTLKGYISATWGLNDKLFFFNNQPNALSLTARASQSDVVLKAAQSDLDFVKSQLAAVIAYGSGPKSVTLTDTAINAFGSVNISNPSTRYTTTSNGDGSVTFNQTQAAVMSLGVRSATQAAASLTLTASASFSTGFSASASGISIGFDSSHTAGTYKTWGAGNAFLTWRSNGSLVVYTYATDGSVAESAASGYTFTPSSPPTFISTDVVKMELAVNASGLSAGGTLNLYKNGTLVYTSVINQLPSGYFVAGLRMPGAAIANVTSASVQTPFSVPAAPAPVTDVATLLRDFLARHPAPSASRYIPSASLARATPPGLTGLPITPVRVIGPGSVELSASPLSAFWAAYGAAISATSAAWVETSGSDATGTAGNPSKPFATIQAAINSAAHLIIVGNGEHKPFQYRQDQNPSGGPKIVAAKNYLGATITMIGGDVIGGNTWTATSGQTGVYQTTVASSSGGSPTTGAVDKVLRMDVQDARGFPARLPLFYSLSALQAAGYGWYYSSGTLYVAMRGANLATGAAAPLKALYLDANGNSRIYLSGKKLCIAGFNFLNVNREISEYVSGTATKAEYWGDGNINFLTPANSHLHHTTGSDVVSMDRNHACSSDHYNYNPGSLGYAGLGMEVCTYSTDAGEIMTYGITDSSGNSRFSNCNASSCHAGNVVRLGAVEEGSYGPGIADTSTSVAVSNITWCVGCISGNGDTRGSNTSPVGFGAYGSGSVNSNNRASWLDTCLVFNQSFAGVLADSYATVKLYNVTSASPVLGLNGSATPSTYSPGSP